MNLAAWCSDSPALHRKVHGRPPKRDAAGREVASSRGTHPGDILLTAGSIVDRDGIAIRSGHHRADLLQRRSGLPAGARFSLACTDEPEEADLLVASIARAQEVCP